MTNEKTENGNIPAAPKKGRGFANMDKAQQREIASKGGKAAHEKGVAHKWTSQEAAEAGRKGGQASSQNRQQQANRQKTQNPPPPEHNP